MLSDCMLKFMTKSSCPVVLATNMQADTQKEAQPQIQSSTESM